MILELKLQTFIIRVAILMICIFLCQVINKKKIHNKYLYLTNNFVWIFGTSLACFV